MNRLPDPPHAARSSATPPAQPGRTRPHRLGILIAGAALAGACATMGGPRDIAMRTVAVHADADAAPAAVAGALAAARARAAFVVAAADAAWFEEVAAASRLHLSGPATAGGLGMAFLAPEPVGDTTHFLAYDGGTFTIQDALYEIEKDRLLDLIAFRIQAGEPVRPLIAALLEYVATDVDNAAAVVMVVAVPDAAVGDSVARMLGPAYSDLRRCEPGVALGGGGEQLRLFYGPEARMYCAGATAEARGVGAWLQAELVMGRR